ncbi:MAG: rhodanese-like domain-containing protein [Pseudomonadota bacterium]|nr:rhodanese-like domain-containing protein [Pseudomonadota bacterium]|tara:strand:- start:74 stop:472 length:399 start_codon:yes stop_codon:yes gene_type:complete
MNIKSSQKLVEEANKSIETLNPTEVKNLMEKDEITLIDVRDIRELWRDGTIENSKHIPRGMLEFWLDPNSSYFKENKIKDTKKMVFFCAMGFRSALATKTLVEMGFKNVANADGGFDALKNAGLKVVQKEKK